MKASLFVAIILGILFVTAQSHKVHKRIDHFVEQRSSSSPVLVNEANEILDRMCQVFEGEHRDECESYVKENRHSLVAKLIGESEAPAATVGCSFCEALVGYFESQLSSAPTEAQVEALLDKVCAFLPQTYTATCNGFVQTYYPQLVQFLISQQPPATVCQEFGICVAAPKPVEKVVAKKPEASVECSLCELLVQQVEYYLEKNTTEAEIISLLDNACNFLPTTEASICDSLVKNYVPQMIQLLVSKENPATVCSQIGICTSAPKPAEKKSVAKPDETIQCTLCEILVKQIEYYLEKNTTETEIISLLDSACNFLPATEASVCDSLVANYVPLMIELLVSKEDPATVCSQVGLCAAAAAAAVVVEKKPEADIQCVLCELVVKDIDYLLSNNKTDLEIIQWLENECSALGSYAGTCRVLVADYGFQLINYILTEETPEKACAQVGLCAASAATAKVAPKASVQCTVCELIVKQIEFFVAKNTTEDQIVSYLESACKFLPATEIAICDSLVANYVPQMIHLILNKEDPATVCTQLGLCTAAPKPAAKLANKESSMECIICELVVKDIDYLLSNNNTDLEIVQWLENKCSVLGSYAGTCRVLVADYGFQLINYILTEETPEKACAQVGLCAAAAAAAKVAPKAPEASVECSLCELLVQQVEYFLEKNTTEAEIVSTLKSACNFLPATEASICDSLVANYVPEMIQLLVSKENPATVCTQLGICTSAAAPKPVEAVAPEVSVECSLCEVLVQQIEYYLEKNSTEAEIISLLDNACNWLPATEATICDSLVKNYVPLMIELLVNKESPATVCSQVGLCAAAAAAKPAEKKTVAKAEETVQCTLCEILVQQIEYYLEKNTTEAEIISILEGACNWLPASEATICDSLVANYVPLMIELLVSKENPATVCSQVGLCAAAAEAKVVVVPEPANKQKTIECVICEMVVQDIDYLLANNKTDLEIVQWLENECNVLGSYAGTCRVLVADYGFQLINYILTEETPEKACSQVGLCAASEKAIPSDAVKGALNTAPANVRQAFF